MTDLTILVSPIPIRGSASSFSSIASRRHRSPSPIMVILESEPVAYTSESAARTAGPSLDPALLSPPINTWKARPRSRAENQRPQHRPMRSQSAPPTQTTFVIAEPPSATASVDDFSLNARKPIRRSRTSFTPGYSYVAEGMTMKGGELVRPPPPLLRPTTFWRRAHRSGVAAASYSPASHLIRRSTYIAAGLAFDAPMHDLSALCVESRLTGEEGVRDGSPRVIELPQEFEFLNL
ncbi:hypothetical protein DFH07DRAFT_801473 [Mycena maculata]|uniref:Uncharacterized protein n=1 Tax=Mycena maculata TaxID=230809 RepID=A0AAD7JXD5_9AGAR|nr:hypothetical protein DFH07DRAFT_801473 [Mycena maculata]